MRNGQRSDIRSEETKSELLQLLNELLTEHSDWRLGQLVANIAFLARQTNSATYDVDDQEFLEMGRAHMQKMAERSAAKAEGKQLLKQLKTAA